MTIIIYSSCVILGAGLAFLLLKSLQWSVGLVNPEKPILSQGFVIGGAIIRWLIIFACLLLALHYSIYAMLTLFFSFLVSRILILAVWDQTIFIKEKVSKLN